MVFLFKQKTAYEMRISDWSSDVCSSDLRLSPLIGASTLCAISSLRAASFASRSGVTARAADNNVANRLRSSIRSCRQRTRSTSCNSTLTLRPTSRSEEHTSELQSLMRISYAVFCLKKKNNHKNAHKLRIKQI